MIEATTSLLMLVSAFYGTAETTHTAAVVQSNVTKTPIVEITRSENIHHDQPQTLERYVRTYFKENPLLAEIARCESTFRHLDKNGSLIRGKVNASDVGVMQINEYYHREQSKKLGFDIHTLEGNMAYAEYLFKKEGSQPWSSSSKCWGNSDKIALK